MLEQDVRWYVRSCHECQTRQIKKIFIPPIVATPASLFRRVHIDTMYLPRAQGFRLLLHARCSLSAYPEARPIRSESARLIATFVFEDIMCRWGAVEEIITDNGAPFVKAIEYMRKRWGVMHIRISGYNSRANAVVERAHRSVRESLIKTCDGNESRWPSVLPAVIWAERVSIQRSTGYSPYRIAHGVEPLFPFDIAEATYMTPPLDAPMTTEELLSVRARQLEKREEDLAAIADRLLKARQESVKQFIDAHRRQIVDYDFEPGSLVLVRNSAVEQELDRKTKPRFFGPMMVVRRTARGAYILSELDGAVSKLPFAAFRVIPYYPRSLASVPVTRVIDVREANPEMMMPDDEAEPDEGQPGDEYESEAESLPEEPRRSHRLRNIVR